VNLPRAWTVVAVGAMYVFIGVGLPALYDPPDAQRLQLWRWTAWVVAAVVGVTHIVFEQRRPGSRPRTTALLAAGAVALGGLGLAVAANLHWLAGPRTGKAPILAIPVWPLVTGIPVFPVALVAAILVARFSRRT